MKRKVTAPKGIKQLIEHFESLPDPRIERTRHHPLINIIVMALCGVICGADGWEMIELYCKERFEFFAGFLDMPSGIPSADTFRRVLSALNPQAFEAAFRKWVATLTGSLAGQTVAIDGKTLRGALARSSEGGPFHLVHVWLIGEQLLLAQRAVEGAPGEIAATLDLLPQLDLKGATVTADANSCTAAMTKECREAGANYVLALKGNRGALHAHVKELFAEAEMKQFRGIRKFESHDQAHGRVEDRVVRAIRLGELPQRMKANWIDLDTAVRVERSRTVNGKTSHEVFYYVTNVAPDPESIAGRIRGHWSIENQLHYCLDVAFNEDARRIHDGNGAQNFALIARSALMLLKRENSRKLSLAMKRRRAMWSHDYLLQVLTAGMVEV